MGNLSLAWYTFCRNQGKGYEMKKSEAIDEQLHITTCDMLHMLKNLRMPHGTAEAKAEACVEFAQAMYKLSNMAQDIAMNAHDLRSAILEEQWNTVLDEMADEMGVK